MDALLAMETRRSVRQYTEQPIDEEKLDIILRAGMAAPSGGNAQAWRFVVVDDKKLLAEISGIHPYAPMAARAPMAIVICADLAAEKFPGLWVQDCSAAMQNMLLAAHASGLGAVWCGIQPDPEREAAFAKLLNLTGQVKAFGLMVLGYPAEHPGPVNRFDLAKVFHNQYKS